MAGAMQFVGVVFFLLSVVSCSASKSAMHDTNGLLLIAIGAVFLVGGSVLDELQRLRAGSVKPPATLQGPCDKDPRQRRLARFFGLR